MKEDLVNNRDYEFAEDVEWQDNELFWIPMRRWVEDLEADPPVEGHYKYSGKV